MTAGSPVMIRIFKAESELELWMQKDGRFELFATYPICFWSGRLGPKLREGDKQAPEGLYSVGARRSSTGKGRLAALVRHRLSQRASTAPCARTGSYILVHGGCTSTGCFAMTNPVMDEIYALSEQALQPGPGAHPGARLPLPHDRGQPGGARRQRVAAVLAATSSEAYDAFERTRVPPAVSVCGRKYLVHEEARTIAGYAPEETTPAACDEGESDPAPVLSEARHSSRANTHRLRKAVSRHRVRRVKGRNTRKAYAAARRARIAAHARRTAH